MSLTTGYSVRTALIRARGFSLVELSIVLIIVGMLAGTAVVPLASSIRQARYQRTDAQLTTIREALYGYMISTGKLACPVSLAATAVTGVNQTCLVQHGGVPATELGLMGERSDQGALLDVWGRAYRYSVSWADHSELGEKGALDWLTVGEIASIGASNLSAEFQLCRSATTSQCSKKALIANQIVWVVHSLGESDGAIGLEAENSDSDNVFVVSAFSSNEKQPFDDQIIWASRSELVYWLLKANWLP